MKNSKITDQQSIALHEPVFDRCRTVFEALKMRRTSRSISDKRISLQILSDILWAAQGVNRVQGPFGVPGIIFVRTGLMVSQLQQGSTREKTQFEAASACSFRTDNRICKGLNNLCLETNFQSTTLDILNY